MLASDSATITYNQSAYINFKANVFDNNLITGVEHTISDESWSYVVTASDSSVICNPTRGTTNADQIKVSSKKTGNYTITITSTLTYKLTKYKPDGITVDSTSNVTDSGSCSITLTVTRPDNIKLVDVRHMFNYASMDMSGKWGIGRDALLIGVDNNDKVSLKFTGLDNATTYTREGTTVPTPVPVTNDTSFDFTVTGNTEKEYQIILKNITGHESTWNVKIFPKEWRNSCIGSLGRSAWGGGLIGYGFAQNLLNTFLKFTSPTNCSSATANQSVTDTRLTHNCGTSFAPTTKNASVQVYTFGTSSNIANELSGSYGILGKWTKYIAQATVTGYNATKYPEYPKWLNGGDFATTRAADYTALKAKFDATTVGNTFTYSFLPKNGGVSFEKSDSEDMYYAIHSCNINFTKIEYTYKKTTAKEAKTQSVVLQATISDLYDFDYGSGGTGNATKGATVQVGAVRGTGTAGQIFQVEINIDKSVSSIGDSVFTSSYYHKLFF
jgi:hypothetical protein